MFNYKFALSKIKSLDGSGQKLPDDFGGMYSLYPPENLNFFDFQPIGRINRIFNAIRKRLKKQDNDIEYYKNELI